MRPQRSKNPALKKKKTPAHPIATLELCVCVQEWKQERWLLVVADAGPSDPYDWTEGPAVGCHPQMFAVLFYTITLGLKEGMKEPGF